jgi:hypothetical protein
MTEAEWLSATDPRMMLEFLRGEASDRKLRLFALVCLTAVDVRLRDARSRAAVAMLEDYADRRASQQSLLEAHAEALDAMNEAFEDASEQRWFLADYAACAAVCVAVDAHPIDIVDVSRCCLDSVGALATGVNESHLRAAESARQSEMIHCVFGNPFAHVAFDPAWRSETAFALATGIYANHAFDRLPILADALEEAGCDHPDVLSHCRGPGPHARGCWVVDGVLGKE